MTTPPLLHSEPDGSPVGVVGRVTVVPTTPGGPGGPGTVEAGPVGPVGPCGPGTVEAGPGGPGGPTHSEGSGGPDEDVEYSLYRNLYEDISRPKSIQPVCARRCLATR